MESLISIDRLTARHNYDLPPAFREYLLMYTEKFFTVFQSCAGFYLGEEYEEKYRHYRYILEKVLIRDGYKKPCLIETFLEVARLGDKEACLALIYSAFVYPMKIIQAMREKEGAGET